MRPTHTHGVLAFCPDHGVFNSFAVAMTDSDVEVLNCQVDCPTPGCTKLAEVLPGKYQANGPNLQYFLDPSITPGALRALQELLRRRDRGEISQEQAVEEASKINSRVAQFVKDWAGPTGALAAILALAIAIKTDISSGEAVKAAELQRKQQIELTVDTNSLLREHSTILQRSIEQNASNLKDAGGDPANPKTDRSKIRKPAGKKSSCLVPAFDGLD